jgi:hypothetical protein
LSLNIIIFISLINEIRSDGSKRSKTGGVKGREESKDLCEAAIGGESEILFRSEALYSCCVGDKSRRKGGRWRRDTLGLEGQELPCRSFILHSAPDLHAVLMFFLFQFFDEVIDL